MNPESIWILLGVLFLGGAIGFYAARKPRPSAIGAERLRGNYLAGVNFLVNEQPDRALEAFLRAAELDGDTVETHFALGSLYRRRGEVDRAIKIHQNIATRETLEPAQREQAGFALAQDYLKAGHARPRREDPRAAGGRRRAPHGGDAQADAHLRAGTGLAARDRGRSASSRRRAAPPQESAIAHYLLRAGRDCPRARCRRRGARAPARRAQRARRFPRGALVRADIAIEQLDLKLAEKLLAAVLVHDAALAIEVVPRLVRLARAAGDGGEAAVARVVAAAPMRSMRSRSPRSWPTRSTSRRSRSNVRACLAQDVAIAGLVRAIGRDPAALDVRAVREIAAILRRLAATTPRYRCANCGFSSIDHFWQCPGCKSLGQPAATAALRSRRGPGTGK